MEKQKNQVIVTRGTAPATRIPQTSFAIILIIVGVVFALITLDVLSFASIGEFFGSFGRAFGEMGSNMGEFFGNMGRDIGRFFGDLGGDMGEFFGSFFSNIGRWWPLILIAAGAFLLIRRRRPVDSE
ncbi:MAG: hypothetical protein JNJ61_14615 [Anaerolineae bacterium]|nr:hypothetical protein [Anaerolineae bacterium]